LCGDGDGDSQQQLPNDLFFPSSTMDPNLRIFSIPNAVPFHARPPTHTIIFLHGRGDSSRNFVETLGFAPDAHGHSITQSFPSIRWVFPEPVARPGGERAMQWFKVPDDLSDKMSEDVQVEGLQKYVASIRNLIHREAFYLNGCYHRIGLMGHCQGAATALHALLSLDIKVMPDDPDGTPLPRRLAAFLAFGARMPFPGRSLAETRAVLDPDVDGTTNDKDPNDNEILRNTPVLLEHCDDDTTYPIKDGRALRDTLIGFGADVTFHEYVRGGHWFNAPCGIEDAIAFLEQTLDLERKDPKAFGRRQ
jgi:predicted esterase